MEITKEFLLKIIQEISEKIDTLTAKLHIQDKQITDLQSKNADLKQSNQITLNQIKDYIQELEEIRSHYVNSNNNTGK